VSCNGPVSPAACYEVAGRPGGGMAEVMVEHFGPVGGGHCEPGEDTLAGHQVEGLAGAPARLPGCSGYAPLLKIVSNRAPTMWNAQSSDGPASSTQMRTR